MTRVHDTSLIEISKSKAKDAEREPATREDVMRTSAGLVGGAMVGRRVGGPIAGLTSAGRTMMKAPKGARISSFSDADMARVARTHAMGRSAGLKIGAAAGLLGAAELNARAHAKVRDAKKKSA